MSQENIRALIIEDDRQVRDFIATLIDLHKSNSVILDAVFASTVAEAETILKDDAKWDVIILDPNLPNGRGVMSVMRFFAQHPTIPLMVLTGDSSDEARDGAMRFGAQSVLRKIDLCSEGSMCVLVSAIRIAIEKHARLLPIIQKWDNLNRAISSAETKVEKLCPAG